MKTSILNEFPFNIKDEAIKFQEYTNLNKFPKEIKKSSTPNSWTTTSYKGYPRFKRIKLPKPKKLNKSIYATIVSRKSIRSFSSTPISLNDLSNFLYFSAGIKDLSKDTENRFYASAGSRYPLEVYLLIQNCKMLKKGVYHYHPKTHSLEFLWELNKLDVKKNFKEKWLEFSPFILIITGVFYRNMLKYGDRGYRHIYLEAGMLSENFYLVGAATNIGCCSVGGYLDGGLEKLLDIDKSGENTLTSIACGYKTD